MTESNFHRRLEKVSRKWLWVNRGNYLGEILSIVDLGELFFV